MSALAALAENMRIGFDAALSLNNLWYCFLGVFLGTLFGVIPGIGPLVAISLLFPITFHLDPTAAIIMLGGIYYGSAYGGSTASILLNVPGTPSNAVACLDGYPMAKQGRAGVALAVSSVASFVGGSIGIVLIMLFSPVIAGAALTFGSAEYFSLMLLGLMAAATLSTGSALKGVAMVVLGVLLGLVGTDVNSGIQRFGFGMTTLFDGISLVALTMGLFGVAEVIASVTELKSGRAKGRRIGLRSLIPTREDVSRSWKPILRGSAIGSFFGTLPGAGGLIASFMAYAVERRVARDPSRFGEGAIEGVASPEAANNAADQTAFIPTMTLGIPGSSTMAIMLGVFMIHGITPGPLLITDHPDLFWGVVMSFWIGNLLLVILNLPLIGIWVYFLTIPYHLLYPAVLLFICIGVYSVNQNAFEVWTVLAFGIVGHLMRVLRFPVAPLILGFVLGPMMEVHLRRAMLMSRGDFATFTERPISASILAVTAGLIVLAAWTAVRRAAAERRASIGAKPDPNPVENP